MSTTSGDPFPSDQAIATRDLLAAYCAALERLRAFGLRSNATDRLSRYERTIAKLAPFEDEDLAQDQRKLLANALCEASIFVDIASLPDGYLEAMLPRLQVLNAGGEFENVDRPDRARNAAVELQVAARCHVRGSLGDPPTERGDVFVRVPRGQFPAEVKRISSPDRVRQRVKEAVSQLQPEGDEPWGVVVLDVSASVRQHFNLIEAGSPAEFLNVASRQVVSFLRHYLIAALKLEEVAREGVLGVLVRLVAYGWAGSLANVRRAIVTQALPVVPEGTAKADTFFEIATAIESGELIAGTNELMQAAVEAFPLPERTRGGGLRRS